MSVSAYIDTVLPSQGIKFILALHSDGARIQRDYHPQERREMVSFMRWAVSKRMNVFISQSGFRLDATDQARRTADLATWQRSLWIDVDCGPAKPYATQREGLAALAAMCKSVGLPNPWVIDSGYGLHVYWPFREDVSTERWRALAARLRAACDASGLHADHTATCDAARVLRPPGTANVKGVRPRAVKVLAAPAATDVATLESLLDAFEPTYTPRLSARDTSPLSANLHPPYWMKGVIAQCPGMRAMFTDKGVRTREPLWKLTLDLINQSADSDAAKLAVAERMSSGHPSYTPGVLREKWSRVQSQNYNPPTCATLCAAGMPECAGCPLRQSITSPVVLGRAEAIQPTQLAHSAQQSATTPMQAPVTPATVQAGVFVFTAGEDTVKLVDGVITKSVAIKDGFPSVLVEKPDAAAWWAPIFKYRLLAARRMIDRVRQHMIVALTFDCATDLEVTIELTGKDFSEPAALVARLTNAGLHVTKSAATKFQEVFMSEFLTQLQRARAASRIASRCGWTDDMSGFVLGTTLYKRGGTESTRPADGATEMDAYTTEGDYAAWRRAFLTAMTGGNERQAVLGLSIGAPLMQFTGVSGLMLNAYSPESGVGKSTLCDAALSVWGAPGRLRHSANDTTNARYKLATILGNLPMVIDEFTNVEGRELSDYIYTITQGREKHRLTSESKLHATPGAWCLPTIVTSNRSMHDKLQEFRSDAMAEAARVFELRVSPLHLSQDTIGDKKAILHGLASNYGFLGPKISALLVAKPPSYWQRLVMERIAWWDKHVAKDSSDRFRVACAALTELGATIGQILGLPFDVDAIREELKRQWASQRDELELSRRKPADYVVAYITDHLSDMAVFGGKDGSAMLSQMPRRVAGEIRGSTVNNRYVPAQVVIPVDQFRAYVRKAHGNYKAVSEWVGREGIADGHVERTGRMVYLRGQPQQIVTNAIAFSASVLGGTKLVGLTAAPPPAPVASEVAV